MVSITRFELDAAFADRFRSHLVYLPANISTPQILSALEFAASTEDCEDCMGLGTVDCSSCSGMGYQVADCEMCSGPIGTVSSPCVDCGDTGEIHYSCRCDGDKRENCATCEGSGVVHI